MNSRVNALDAPNSIDSRLLDSVLKRVKTEDAVGFYYPLMFAVGSTLSPEDFLINIEKIRGCELVDKDEFHRATAFYHELVHALTFLGTPYGGTVLALANDASSCAFWFGGGPEKADPKRVRLQISEEVVEEELWARFSVNGMRGISDHDLERRRKWELYSELSERIDEATGSALLTAKDCFERLRREIETNLVIRKFVLPSQASYKAGLQEISGELLCEAGESRNGVYVQLDANRTYPCFVYTYDDRVHALVINAAIVFECVAIVAEIELMEFISGSVIPGDEVASFLGELPVEYRVCFDSMANLGVRNWNEQKAALLAITEICFTFGEIGNLIREGYRRSVGELFLDCCNARRGPLLARCSAQSWYWMLLRRLGSSAPRKSRMKALGHIGDYLENHFPFEQMDEPLLWFGADSLFSQALSVALFLGRQSNTGRLAISDIVSPEKLTENMLLAQNSICFFDPVTRRRWPIFRLGASQEDLGFHYFDSYAEMGSKNSFGGILMAYLAYKISRGEEVECPLKMGIPFKCTENSLGFDEFCDIEGQAVPLKDDGSNWFEFYCPLAALTGQYADRIKMTRRYWGSGFPDLL